MVVISTTIQFVLVSYSRSCDTSWTQFNAIRWASYWRHNSNWGSWTEVPSSCASCKLSLFQSKLTV